MPGCLVIEWNEEGSLVVVLAAAGYTVDMGVVGPLGFVAWAVIAVAVVVLVLFGQFGKQPELAPRR